MKETTVDDVLARLAAQEAELARLRRQVGGRRREVGRFRRAWLAALALIALIALPLGVLAADPFNDLDPAQASGHNPNIALIADAGITKGCNPPLNTSYCPKDYVTREQMASFLARAAGLGANPPVANAAKLGGYPVGSLTRVAAAGNPNDLALGASETDVLSVTLEVPQQGYVLVQFTGYWYAQSDTGCPCTGVAYLRQDGNASQRVTEQNLGNDGVQNSNGSAKFARENAAGSALFLATPGSHTFTLRARRSNGTSTNMGLAAVNLQALLLPFGASGGAATDLPPSPARPGSSSDR